MTALSGRGVRRRLDLGWMSGRDRVWARVGVTGTAAAAAGVIAAGLGDQHVVVTQLGTFPVAAAWVIVVAHLGLALASAILLRVEAVRPVIRVGAGFVLAAMAGAQIERALRPIEASLDVGPLFVAARVVAWLALACGVAVMIGRRPGAPARLALVGGSGFMLLLTGHGLALLGAPDGAHDLVRGMLTDAVWFSAERLSWWLLVFAVWQVVEGVHGSSDAGRVGVASLSSRSVTVLVAIKAVLLVAGFGLLSPSRFDEWAAARAASPMAWAYGIVLAIGVVTWLRAPVGPGFERRALFRTALAVVVVWEAPFMAAFLLTVVAELSLVLIPSSAGDILSILAACAAVFAVLDVVGRGRVRRWAVAAAAMAFAGAAFVSHASTAWSRGVEGRIIDRLGGAVTWLTEGSLTWQAWALVLLPFAALGWIALGRGARRVAVGVFVVGVWILPRAIDVLLGDVLGVATPRGIAPNMLMFDVALTFVALAALNSRRGTTRAIATSIGLVVAVVTIVTHGRELGRAVASEVASVIGSWANTDADALAFVILLVFPAVWAALFDSGELNRERSKSAVFTAIGASCILFVVAVVLISAGTMTGEDSRDQLFRALVLPGVTVVAGLTLAQRVRESPHPSRPGLPAAAGRHDAS